MPNSFARYCSTLACCLLVVSARAAETTDPHSLREFFTAHCYPCHGEKKQKGDLRLDTFAFDFDSEDAIGTGEDILIALEDGDMPPEDEPQPSEGERAEAVAWLDTRLRRAAAAMDRRETVLRRLNKAQYANTVSDLLGVDARLLGLTDSFPADELADGFDNNGEALSMSDFLLNNYLNAAHHAIEAALESHDTPPPYRYDLAEDERILKRNGFPLANPVPELAFLYQNDERAPGDPRGQRFPVYWRLATVPDDAQRTAGVYEITFEVESKGRGALMGVFGGHKRNDYPVYYDDELHRLELYIVSSDQRGATRLLVETIDLPDDERQTFTRRHWLPAGWSFELAFGNGPAFAFSDYPTLLGHEWSDEYESLPKRDQNDLKRDMTHKMLRSVDAPRIVIYGLTERGPFPAGGTASKPLRRLARGAPPNDTADALREFAQHAFRRPVPDEEIEPFVQLAQTHAAGYRAALEAMLCSPFFVYHDESPGRLDAYALAARLSYLFWNTMPDARLMARASDGSLTDPDTLRAETERLLADPRSDEFVRGFVWQWLGLQNTRDMPPDAEKFYDYYRQRIAISMAGESGAFFRHLLDENLSVANLIDSDFAFLNADMARHYTNPTQQAVPTFAFQKVTLEPGGRRGGLLGQASVLTASANGVDTSPVVRGIWILEKLLGTPPPPPPDDVVIAEPDARGDLTLRELYAKHRTIESCNRCHRKIDPLGFALENYDPVGRWRDVYDSGHAVDGSGQLPDGHAFGDVSGMKQAMGRDPDPVARNLIHKLMAYASGRTVTAADHPEIDRIAKEVAAEGYGLRDIVMGVVTSEAFVSK
ncbi:MAG: DUF1592 domain-containing protein [Planctomycetota bacterium]|jgi:hypothetical protein